MMLVMPYHALPPRSQRLCDWARTRGFALRGLYWDRRADEAGFRNPHGVEWREVYRGGGEASWRLGFHYPRFAHRVYRALVRARPAVVMAFDLDAAIGCAWAKRVYDFHFVYDIADNFSLRHNFPEPVRSTLHAIERHALRAADLVLLPDQSRITTVEEPFREKVTVIYNCPARGSLTETARGHRDNATFLLSGYLTETRGCRTVLEAASAVTGARILVAGHAPDPVLQAAIETHPQVEFAGQVSHAESLEQFARAQAVFTFYEPSIEINRRAASNKWYDAMMTGTPVIVNREVLAAHWLDERGMAYVVPYGDHRALAQTMQRILADPREASEKGSMGRRLFETEFNWELMETRLDAAFARGGIHPKR